MHFTLSILGLSVAIASASPLEVRASSDCAAAYTPASILEACKSYKPYCSSIAPVTAVTSTVTQTTTKKVTLKDTRTLTITGPISTFTESAVTTTLPVVTVAGEMITVTESTSVGCTVASASANQKRLATDTFGPCVSSFDAKWTTADRTAACKCLQVTPTSKIIVKTTVISTVTSYKATSTTTPVYRETPTSTITLPPVITHSTTTVTSITYSTFDPTSADLANQTKIAPADYDNYGGYNTNAFMPDSPFPMTLYSHTSSRLQVSTNGFVALTRDCGDGCFNQSLPIGGSLVGPDSCLHNVSFAPYWIGQIVFASYSVPRESPVPGILAYEVSGVSPNRTLTFEWRTHVPMWNTQYNSHVWYMQHYAAACFENSPAKACTTTITCPAFLRRSNSPPGFRGTDQFAQHALDDGPKVYSGLELMYYLDTNSFSGRNTSVCPAA